MKRLCLLLAMSALAANLPMHSSFGAEADDGEAIVAQLRDKSFKVRREAVKKVAKRDDPQAIELLIGALGDRDREVARIAAKALGSRKEPEVDRAFAKAIASNQHAEVRRVAVARLQKKPQERDFPHLLIALRDADGQVRRTAAKTLGRLGDSRAFDALLSALDDRDDQVMEHAADALHELMEANPPDESKGRARWLAYVLNRELRHQPLSAATPAPRIELVGGETLVGKLAGYSISKSQRRQATPSALVELSGCVQRAGDSRSLSVRIDPRWLRRVTWRSHALRDYQPGTAWDLEGVSHRYQKVRWSEQGILLLGENGLRKFAFNQLSELHLPWVNRWDAFVSQLALSDDKLPQRLYYFQTSDYNRMVIPSNRFQVFGETGDDLPAQWGHHVRPFWCRDTLFIPYAQSALVANVPPEQVPLAWQEPDRSEQRSTIGGMRWQLGSNVAAGPLVSANESARWGIGVMVNSTLEFPTPDFALAFQAKVGLDRLAGNGGCARALIFASRKEGREKLFESPCLIGSSTVQNVGPIALSADATAVHLVADDAHEDRPPGADPFNIRDLVDWIEPTLILDEERLRAAIATSRHSVSVGVPPSGGE